jgi:hypothetical protein
LSESEFSECLPVSESGFSGFTELKKIKEVTELLEYRKKGNN